MLRATAILLAPMFAAASAAPQEPATPGKFIPTFAVKYSGLPGWPSLADAAKFDLLVMGAYQWRRYPSDGTNTWQKLKALNPRIIIIVYKLGPSRYNTAPYGKIGRGWEWIKAEHGIGAQDRWTAVGAKYGTYLQYTAFMNERMMLIGNPRWRQFWIEKTYDKFWGGPKPTDTGADGIFADCTDYSTLFRLWNKEGEPDKQDLPKAYFARAEIPPEFTRKYLREYWASEAGQRMAARFRRHTNEFLNAAVPWLRERNKILVPNFTTAGSHMEFWDQLDAQPHAVWGALEEGAFMHPWRTNEGITVLAENKWLDQVKMMSRMKRVRLLMNVHGKVVSDKQDLARMDAASLSGVRGWDALWYGMTSFLMGFDDVRRNAYMNFTVWGYARFFWLKEFDPAYLHLGKARSPLRKVAGAGGHVYLREFDDGWAVANPTRKDVKQIAVPLGRARVLDHDNFEQASKVPLVKAFGLPAHRGVILLKEGRQAGNGDNP